MSVGSLNLEILVILLMVLSAVSIAVKWIKLPYSIALVIVGLLIGIFNLLPPVVLTPDLILLIFLPVLLFEASWSLDLRNLRTSALPVSVLATIGVGLSTVAVAAVMSKLTGLDFHVALVFGAMVSATDPISVLALFKRLDVHKRLHVLLEGESLLNDGTAVVLFRLLVASVMAGGAISYQTMAVDFFIVTLGGTLIGLLVGWIAAQVTRLFDDHLLESTLTLIVAYGSYLLAEHLHVSAVIAVLVAGIIMGNYGARVGMSPTTRLAVSSFWEFAAFIAESLVFVLIGLHIDLHLLVNRAPMIAAGVTAILVARFCVIFVLTPFLARRTLPIPWSWRFILFWGGLRGSLCMAMALSLPKTMPDREAVVITSFGVVLFTLLVQGLTMEPLMKLLKIQSRNPARLQYQSLTEQLAKQEQLLVKLEDSFRQARILKKDYMEKRRKIEQSIESLKLSIVELRDSSSDLEEVERVQTARALLSAQKDCLERLSRKGVVSKETLEQFRLDIDHSIDEIRSFAGGERPSVVALVSEVEQPRSGEMDSTSDVTDPGGGDQRNVQPDGQEPRDEEESDIEVPDAELSTTEGNDTDQGSITLDENS